MISMMEFEHEVLFEDKATITKFKKGLSVKKMIIIKCGKKGNPIFKIALTLLTYCFMLSNTHGQQRPKILEQPVDVIASSEEPLTLNCKATGRPQPDIIWYQNGSPLVPSERRVVLPEGSLFFLRILNNNNENDTGVYWCEARSSAGFAVSNNVSLQIAQIQDKFELEPLNETALVGGDVKLNCIPPRGIPYPSVLWYKNKKLVDLRDNRLSLVGNGTLLITKVMMGDSGDYECLAQNMAGIKNSKLATLKVLTPPRVIRGPSNTEVIENDRIDIPCEIEGDPKPISTWVREGKSFPDGRFRILLDNTLRIEAVRVADEGRYTCLALNDGGNLSISINIRVFAVPRIIEASSDLKHSKKDYIKIYCRSTGRPTPIIVWDKLYATHHSVNFIESKLQTSNNNLGSIKIEENHIEHADTNFSNGFENILHSSKSVEDIEFEIKDKGELLVKKRSIIQPAWFICAAINEAGSNIKAIFINSTSMDISPSLENYIETPHHIFITQAISVSFSTLDVLWEHTQSPMLEQLMTIYYRPIRINEPEGRLLFRDYLSVQTVYERKMCRLMNLKPYTTYEVFATSPSKLTSSISNLRRGKTLDGPPSAPPMSIRVGVINTTAAYVRWSPPPKHLINGELTGYKIQIKSNSSKKLLGQMSLNASTHSVVINSLSPGSSYLARVAAFTKGGLGPYSPSAYLHVDTSNTPITSKSDPAINSFPVSWSLGILLSLIGFMVLSLTIVTISWTKKNNVAMKSYSTHCASASNYEKNHTVWLRNFTTEATRENVHPQSLILETGYTNVSSINISKSSFGNFALLEPYVQISGNNEHFGNAEKNALNSFYKLPHNESYQKIDMNSMDQNGFTRKQESLKDNCDPLNSKQKLKDSNITIRTNPSAYTFHTQIVNFKDDWSSSRLPPPIPDFPHDWIQERKNNLERVDSLWCLQKQDKTNISSTTNYFPSNYSLLENKINIFNDKLETTSVSYEKVFRGNESEFFSHIGEPTEKYYRNVNMEFNHELYLEPSSSPLPCQSHYKKLSNLHIISSKSSLEIYNENCESLKKNHISIENDNILINNPKNNLHELTCSSDEYETDQKNIKHRPRRIRPKINEKWLSKNS